VRGCHKICIISHEFVSWKMGWVGVGGILWGVFTILSHLVQIFQLELDLAIPLATAAIESIVALPNVQPNIELDES
jgi:hypothetical protein